jgi:hypothetical protein
MEVLSESVLFVLVLFYFVVVIVIVVFVVAIVFVVVVFVFVVVVIVVVFVVVVVVVVIVFVFEVGILFRSLPRWLCSRHTAVPRVVLAGLGHRHEGHRHFRRLLALARCQVPDRSRGVLPRLPVARQQEPLEFEAKV